MKVNMAKTMIIPAVNRQLGYLADDIAKAKAAGLDASSTVSQGKKVAELANSLSAAVDKLEASIAASKKEAELLSDMAEVRKYADLLEREVSDDICTTEFPGKIR